MARPNKAKTRIDDKTVALRTESDVYPVTLRGTDLKLVKNFLEYGDDLKRHPWQDSVIHAASIKFENGQFINSYPDASRSLLQLVAPFFRDDALYSRVRNIFFPEKSAAPLSDFRSELDAYFCPDAIPPGFRTLSQRIRVKEHLIPLVGADYVEFTVQVPNGVVPQALKVTLESGEMKFFFDDLTDPEAIHRRIRIDDELILLWLNGVVFHRDREKQKKLIERGVNNEPFFENALAWKLHIYITGFLCIHEILHEIISPDDLSVIRSADI